MRLGLFDDETSEFCHWQIPEAHALEAWSDARAFDGTLAVQQPLIAPLYDGKSAHEVVQALLGDSTTTGYAIVQNAWKARVPPTANFDKSWRKIVHDGLLPEAPIRPWPRRRSRASGCRRNLRRIRAISMSPSGWIPTSSTAATPTTAGCRSCPSPSPS